jgi:ABC-type polysaccharide/polyol phosphate transport system ATPase subunit
VLASSQPVLLAVGAALQGDLSGRRNIIIGASALGIAKADVARADGRHHRLHRPP